MMTIDQELVLSAEVIDSCKALRQQIEAAATMTINRLRLGGRLYLAGNGGSAALAQHLAAEMMGRYQLERPSIPAFCLSDNQAAVTAIGNDYGYLSVFHRQLYGIVRAEDILWLFSTSGTSPNIITLYSTLCYRPSSRPAVVLFTGQKVFDCAKHEYPCLVKAPEEQVIIAVPSRDTPRIQEAHQTIGHILCGMIERAIHADTEAAISHADRN